VARRGRFFRRRFLPFRQLLALAAFLLLALAFLRGFLRFRLGAAIGARGLRGVRRFQRLLGRPDR